MNIAVGPGLSRLTALFHAERLSPRLDRDETVLYIGGSHPHMGYDAYVVTTERVLFVATSRGYAITDEFEIKDVQSTYVEQDPYGHTVHVPTADDGHWLLRPHDSPEGAGELARAITSAAAKKRPDRPRPLAPEQRPGLSPLEQAGLDYLLLVIPRDEVESRDLAPALSVLEPLIRSRRTARSFMERVCLAIDGYNDTDWELFEIPEVRDYVQKLDAKFPYWLFFLDKRTSSFDAIWRCFMPPFLTAEAQAEEFPRRLDPLLRNWWTPAMDSVCDFVGLRESDHYALCERYALYFQGHRDF